MILDRNIKGSILLYVMLLVNIALVVGIVVYNNSYVIVNNIDVGNNQEEVYSNIYNKGHIALQSVIKYNANGEGFLDGISCPQDITMSGSLNRTTGIATTLVYQYGKVHCLGTYNGNDFKIHYDDEVNDFSTAQYDGDIVNIIESIGTEITVENSPINLSNSDVSSSTPWGSYVKANSVDDNTSTWFDSNYRNSVEYLEFEVGSNQSIGKIIIRKPSHGGWSYWDSGNIKFYNGSTVVFNTSLSGMIGKTYHEIDLKYRGLTNDVDSIRLETNWRYLDVSEFEVYLLNTISAGNEGWEGDRVFTDTDNTLISFSKDGIEGNDGIDDDLNSDNYKVTSIGNTYFPNNYQDDDVVPRKTIFGSVNPNTSYQHVYWNNYRTIKIIEDNTNNDDILNAKMGDVSDANIFINTFNTEDLNYNIKILEFDREVYKNQFTLLPLNSYEGKNIDEYLGYIQKDPVTGVLSVLKEKDELNDNSFVFDFQNKDYAIFFANNSNATLSYHLESYTDSGSGVYINPIDDSGTGTISVLSNHIIIGGEKNFIGENFEVVGPK